jgi:hypothetical protein
MGGSQSLHIEKLPICGLLSVELFTIPGGYPTILYTDVKLGLALGSPGTGP